MDRLAEFIVDKSKPIFEIWMPKVLDNLRAVFMSDENRKILADIGEVVAGAVIIGFEAAFKGLIRSNVKGVIKGFMPESSNEELSDMALDFALDKLIFSDQKVSAANNSAYEAEAYGNGSSGDTININYPTINGVHNLSELVEEMAKLKQISDTAGGAFS